MIEREKMLLAYMEAYNRFDIDAMLDNLDADITFENRSNGVTTMTLYGLEAFKKQAEEAKALFTERKQTALSFTHNANNIEVPIDYYAVLAVDLPSGLKKGDVLKLQGKSIFTFKENKIISITDMS